jgi:putative transposase
MSQQNYRSRHPRLFRVSHRLRGFDYTLPEVYYVTICTYGKRCVFGVVNGDEVHLNRMGMIVREEWLRTPIRRRGVELREFIIMPNHLHGIVVLGDLSEGKIVTGTPVAGDLRVAPTGGGKASSVGVRPRGPAPDSLGALMAQFKGAVTRRVRRELSMSRYRIWQRDYYDHIIRDGDDWDRIRAYILENPANWHSDPENPNP